MNGSKDAKKIDGCKWVPMQLNVLPLQPISVLVEKVPVRNSLEHKVFTLGMPIDFCELWGYLSLTEVSTCSLLLHM